jgi:hypothetical protein
MRRPLLLLALCALLHVSAAPHPRAWRRAVETPPWTSTPAQRHTTLIDHFSPGASGDTWAQRYFVNATFWEAGGRRGPVFLCVGGEGARCDTTLRQRAWR